MGRLVPAFACLDRYLRPMRVQIWRSPSRTALGLQSTSREEVGPGKQSVDFGGGQALLWAVVYQG